MNKFVCYIRIQALLMTTLLVVSTVCIGQVKNIGKIVSYKKVSGGIEGKTSTAIFDVHAYSDQYHSRKSFKEYIIQ